MIIDYRDRPEGSESKLNTYSDGLKVLGTILRLYKDYRPFGFFCGISAVLFLISTLFLIPVLREYFQIGLVDRFPTLIVCGFVYIAALISFFTGMLLTSMVQKNRCDFEMELNRINHYQKRWKEECEDEQH